MYTFEIVEQADHSFRVSIMLDGVEVAWNDLWSVKRGHEWGRHTCKVYSNKGGHTI